VPSAGCNEEEGLLLRLRILEKFHRGLAGSTGTLGEHCLIIIIIIIIIMLSYYYAL